MAGTRIQARGLHRELARTQVCNARAYPGLHALRANIGHVRKKQVLRAGRICIKTANRGSRRRHGRHCSRGHHARQLATHCAARTGRSRHGTIRLHRDNYVRVILVGQHHRHLWQLTSSRQVRHINKVGEFSVGKPHHVVLGRQRGQAVGLHADGANYKVHNGGSGR